MTAPAQPRVYRPIIAPAPERRADDARRDGARLRRRTSPLLERMGVERAAVAPGQGGPPRAGKANGAGAPALATSADRGTVCRRPRAPPRRLATTVELATARADRRRATTSTTDRDPVRTTSAARLAPPVMTPDAIRPTARAARLVAGQPAAAGLTEGLPRGCRARRRRARPRRRPRARRRDHAPAARVSRPPRSSNGLFPRVHERLGRDPASRAVVIAAHAGQREYLATAQIRGDPPGRRGRRARADRARGPVVSAGGTMSREAEALRTPVYEQFAGRLARRRRATLRAGRLRSRRRREIELVEQRGASHRRAIRRPGRPVARSTGTFTRMKSPKSGSDGSRPVGRRSRVHDPSSPLPPAARLSMPRERGEPRRM